MTASIAFALLCLSCIILGAGVGKPLGSVAIALSLLALLLQLGFGR